MIKLFSMFVRYAQLPEKEFVKVAQYEIGRIAESLKESKTNEF